MLSLARGVKVHLARRMASSFSLRDSRSQCVSQKILPRAAAWLHTRHCTGSRRSLATPIGSSSGCTVVVTVYLLLSRLGSSKLG